MKKTAVLPAPANSRAANRRRVIGRLMHGARGVRLRVLVQLWLREAGR